MKSAEPVSVPRACEASSPRLTTPLIPFAGDKLVEHASTLELVDTCTRISKTDYKLGWPASPRDTITISRTFSDSNPSSTLIDISTSVPRSPDEEPAFLRPAPPYVRSNVHLLAWCLQLVPASPNSLSANSSAASPSTSTSSTTGCQKLRITIFWQWSLGGAVFATHQQQIASLLASFVSFVREQGSQIPLVRGWGRGVEVSRSSWDRGQETRTCEYAVVWEEEGSEGIGVSGEAGLEALERSRERRRLERAVEFNLSAREGWDVRVTAKAVGGGAAEGAVDIGWTAAAEMLASSSSPTSPNQPSSPQPAGDASSNTPPTGRLTLRLTHAPLAHHSALVRVTVALTRLAGGKVLRVNGDQLKLAIIEPRDPSRGAARALVDMDDGASIATTSTAGTGAPEDGSPQLNSSAFTTASNSGGTGTPTNRTLLPSSSSSQIQSLLRRNYIYFTSLLQEPEAKWRSISDSRGVTVTQLNSIDPTLTIYRAEATFVGVGVWDVFASVLSYGARMSWDKNLEEASLVEDVSELSELWWLKTKAAWPVA